MRKYFFLAIVLTLVAVGRTAPGDQVTQTSLSAFFKSGAAFQDRNGDGVVDFVDARIVLPERPSAAEVAAAATVAARLGYETTAMNLPLDVARRLQPSYGGTGAAIYVGARSLAPASVTADAIGAGTMKAGDGVVAAFTVAGQPSVAVLGGDEDGLNA